MIGQVCRRSRRPPRNEEDKELRRAFTARRPVIQLPAVGPYGLDGSETGPGASGFLSGVLTRTGAGYSYDGSASGVSSPVRSREPADERERELPDSTTAIFHRDKSQSPAVAHHIACRYILKGKHQKFTRWTSHPDPSSSLSPAPFSHLPPRCRVYRSRGELYERTSPPPPVAVANAIKGPPPASATAIGRTFFLH